MKMIKLTIATITILGLLYSNAFAEEIGDLSPPKEKPVTEKFEDFYIAGDIQEYTNQIVVSNLKVNYTSSINGPLEVPLLVKNIYDIYTDIDNDLKYKLCEYFDAKKMNSFRSSNDVDVLGMHLFLTTNLKFRLTEYSSRILELDQIVCSK